MIRFCEHILEEVKRKLVQEPSEEGKLVFTERPLDHDKLLSLHQHKQDYARRGYDADGVYYYTDEMAAHATHVPDDALVSGDLKYIKAGGQATHFPRGFYKVYPSIHHALDDTWPIKNADDPYSDYLRTRDHLQSLMTLAKHRHGQDLQTKRVFVYFGHSAPHYIIHAVGRHTGEEIAISLRPESSEYYSEPDVSIRSKTGVQRVFRDELNQVPGNIAKRLVRNHGKSGKLPRQLAESVERISPGIHEIPVPDDKDILDLHVEKAKRAEYYGITPSGFQEHNDADVDSSQAHHWHHIPEDVHKYYQISFPVGHDEAITSHTREGFGKRYDTLQQALDETWPNKGSVGHEKFVAGVHSTLDWMRIQAQDTFKIKDHGTLVHFNGTSAPHYYTHYELTPHEEYADRIRPIHLIANHSTNNGFGYDIHPTNWYGEGFAANHSDRFANFEGKKIYDRGAYYRGSLADYLDPIFKYNDKFVASKKPQES